MRTKGIGATDIGLRRSNNEDSYFADDRLGLYVVCDGMGGHSGGEVASFEAARTVAEFFDAKSQLLSEVRRTGDFERLGTLATEAVKLASNNVWNLAEQRNLGGMGTTLTMLIVAGGKGVVASVGDSRAYLMHDRVLAQITKDHTYAEEMHDWGLDADQIRNYRHLLTRAVGYEKTVEVDTFLIDLSPHDRVLLCSDGLSNYFDELKDLNEFVMKEDANALPHRLVAEANVRGGSDNITAIVVEVIPTPYLQPHVRDRVHPVHI